MTDNKQAVTWMMVLLFVGGAFTAFLSTGPHEVSATSDGRSIQGVLSKVPEVRGKNLRAVDWKPGTDLAYLVGQDAIYQYDASSKNLTVLDGSESTDNYYYDIAWRPEGDYAVIVGATPLSTRSNGVIEKMWYDGSAWKIVPLSTSITAPLTGIAWSSDGSIAVLVGGAPRGEPQAAKTIMLRFSGLSNAWTIPYSDNGPSGLSAVSYNQVLNKFFAVGLDGRMMTYDGAQDQYVFKNGSLPKAAALFSITWRDNGGRAMIAGWFDGTLKGYIYTTDGTYTRLVTEVYVNGSTAYVNDASWAPGSDYTMFVGQTGILWEYSVATSLTRIPNPFDTDQYNGVDFSPDGKVAIIVGQAGGILRYDATYPPEQNVPPSVIISSPPDNQVFDYAQAVTFSSNGSHDDDLDPMTFQWSSSLDGTLSNQAEFTTKDLTTGKHQITLSAQDPSAHTSKTYINLTIRPPKDRPVIDAGPDKIGYVAEDVALDGKVISFNNKTTIKTYEWDCLGTGDFRVTTGPTGSCRYGQTGEYNATLRVTDARLAVSTDIVNVTIFPKLTSAKDLVIVQTPGPLHQGEVLAFRINVTKSKGINISLVDPKGTEIVVYAKVVNMTLYTENGTYYISLNVPPGYKNGMYSIKWRYQDQNHKTTDPYIVPNAIQVKKYKEASGPDLATYIAVIVVIVIIAVAAYFIVMFVVRREVYKLEAAVLFYRDGRVLSAYVPADAMVQAPVAAPAPPPAAAPPPDQYAPPQYQAPAAPPIQAPPAAPPAAPVLPSNEGTMQAQAVVQGTINDIRQGTAQRIPDKVLLGHRKVLIEQGQHTIIAVSVFGPEPAKLRKGMKNSLQEIEIVYGNQLRNWDGLVHDMPRLQSIIEKEIKVRD